MPTRSPAYFLQHAYPPGRFYCFVLARAFLSLPFSNTACNVFVSFRRFALPRPSLGFIKGRFPPCCACRRALPFSAPLFWSRLPCFAFFQNIVTQSPAPARLLSFSLLLSGRFCSFYRSQGSCLFQTLSALLLLPSSFAFSRALFLLFRFGARFSSLLASYTAFQSAFLSGLHLCFSCRFSLHFSKNKLPPCNTYRCACLFLSFLFFLSCPIFLARLSCFAVSQ